jgi:(1->4)-alpha-D-glucan 1-alpha-D-glucosylmutase
VLKFQQYTGPIMAKGLEDTAFYIFNRLAALNDVGGEPQQFGMSPEAFHQRNQQRGREWPSTLLTTSTHDTKRSEDVRARMVSLSEVTDLWRRSLPRWRNSNRRWKKQLEETEAPDANEEYLLYQTLLGSWPVAPNGQAERNASPEYVERIQAYMNKALNEAKLNTSWVQPNEEWLEAMKSFVAGILDPSSKNRFLPNFLPVVEEVARLGAVNSLTQTLLKLTVPGVPDIYQGNEIWDFSLVDPDNRRPVDFGHRQSLLQQIAGADPAELLRTWPDGRLKLFLTQRVLTFRREHSHLFKQGSYIPVATTGAFGNSCVAFVRQSGAEWIMVIASRVSARVGFPPIGDNWQDTVVEAPAELNLDGTTELFTGRAVEFEDRRLAVRKALAVLPFAVVRLRSN